MKAHPQRQFERVASALTVALPGASTSRTRDAIQIEYLGERGVVLLLTPDALEIRLPTVDWTSGTYAPQTSSVLFSRIVFADLPTNANECEVEVLDAIEAAVGHRQAQFKECRFCKLEFPPEHMTEDACHNCASKHLGLVY